MEFKKEFVKLAEMITSKFSDGDVVAQINRLMEGIRLSNNFSENESDEIIEHLKVVKSVTDYNVRKKILLDISRKYIKK